MLGASLGNVVRRTPRVLALVGAGAAVLVFFGDSIRSASADLAHHVVLVARLVADGHLPGRHDANLGEMAVYPPLSHVAAAVLACVVGSSLRAVVITALVSLVVLWASLGTIVQSLPPRARALASALLLGLVLANWGIFHFELFGSEIVRTFFFAQLAGQALVVAALVVALHAERRGVRPLVRYVALGATALVAEWVHLLPAVELGGALGVLVLVEAWNARRSLDGRAVAARTAVVAVTALVGFFHPSAAAMRTISSHDGALALVHVTGLGSILRLCEIVGALSFVLLVRWLHAPSPEARRQTVAAKYLGALGMAVAVAALAQMLALALHAGSEYACRKYVFGLQTLAAVEGATLVPLLLKGRWLDEGPDVARAWLSASDAVLPALLVLAGCSSAFRYPETASVARVVALEKDAAQLRTEPPGGASGRYDYAIAIEGVPNLVDYLLTIGVLHAPRAKNALDIFMGRPLSEPERVGRVVTSLGNRAWDRADCRLGTPAGSLVAVDGRCLVDRMRSPRCAGEIDFSSEGDLRSTYPVTGFSVGERGGRWSDGNEATFSCSLPPAGEPRPAHLYLRTRGFVLPAHPQQRLLISVNGGPPQRFAYEYPDAQLVIDLDVSRVSGDSLRLRFTLPDAVAPGDVGASEDPRRLGMLLQSMRFE